MTDKNPYTGNKGHVNTTAFVLGQVSISASGSDITVNTCDKYSSGTTCNQLTAKVTVE